MAQQIMDSRPLVILLGASNLTLGFPLVVESLRRSLGRPVEILAAHGHGRSFGNWSRVLFRALPGIEQSQLWSALEHSETAGERPLALLTDLGNDLIYGATVPTTVVWVESCLKRLSDRDARIVITLLPMSAVERLSACRYHLTRMLFFPGQSRPWPEMLRAARELNDELRKLGKHYGVTLIEPKGEWYGFDPIHIRRSRRVVAWKDILSHWEGLPAVETCWPSWAVRLQLWRLTAAQRRLFGRPRTSAQPVLRYEDGTTLSLY